jgi:hypothetical protein
MACPSGSLSAMGWTRSHLGPHGSDKTGLRQDRSAFPARWAKFYLFDLLLVTQAEVHATIVL